MARCLRVNLPRLPSDVSLLWSSWRCNSFSKCWRVIWDVLAAACFWGIWRERNNRIFNDLTRSSEQTYHICFSFIFHWINLLSVSSRELARQSVDLLQMGDNARNHSEEVREEGILTRRSCDRWLGRPLVLGEQSFPDFCYGRKLFFGILEDPFVFFYFVHLCCYFFLLQHLRIQQRL